MIIDNQDIWIKLGTLRKLRKAYMLKKTNLKMPFPHILFFTRLLTLGVVSIISSQAAFANITANFESGMGTNSWDQYSGVAGGGWVGGWDSSKSLRLDSTNITISSSSPFSGGGSSYLSLTGVAASNATNTANAAYLGVVRQFSTNSATGGINATQAYTISFDFRLDSSASTVGTLIFADKIDSSLGTGGGQLWAITGTSSGWTLINGNGSGGSSNNITIGSVASNVIYSFTITMHPGTSSTTTTWDLNLNYGTNSFYQTGLGIRNSTNYTAGTYLQFSETYVGAGQTNSFSIDNLVIAQIPEMSTDELLGWALTIWLLGCFGATFIIKTDFMRGILASIANRKE